MAGIISDLQQIYGWIVYLKDVHTTIEGNKDRCRLLISRCGAFENCLRSLDKKRLEDANVSAGVHTLACTIGKCVKFVNKYGKKGWKRFVLNSSFAKSIENEFKDLNFLLSQSANDLHFSLSVVHSYDIDNASTADNEVMTAVLGELLEANARITSDQSNILSRLNDQSLLLARMADMERMMPELLQRSCALFDLVQQQQQQQQQPQNPHDNELFPSVEVDSSPVSAQKSSYDDLKFAAVDMDAVVWDKTKIIGKGSFATVYSCTYDGGPCALKHFENIHELTLKERLSIKREARIMQVAKHAHIIGFLGVNVETGIILSELAVNSLHKLLHLQDPAVKFSFGVKLEWLLGIASALRYLHFHGIIHRDVKPQNVLLCGNPMVAKLADFGISTAVGMSTIGSSANNSNGAAGSVPYMAPELLDFDEATGPVYSPAIDVYSFGVLANELMTLELPWNGLKAAQIGLAMSKGRRPKAFVVTTAAERGLVALCGDATSGCWSADPNERPTSAVIVKQLRNLQSIYENDMVNESEALYVKGLACYQYGNYAEGFKLLSNSADRNNAKAQFYMGICYKEGKGIAMNFKEAFKWFKLSAEQGYAKAQYFVAACHNKGEGVDVNQSEAFRYYKLCADQGDADAQYNVALRYDSGRGVEVNRSESIRYCQLSADQGNATAQFLLASFYNSGKGVAMDLKEAFKYCKLSADQGNASAQCNLAAFYACGKGVVEVNLSESFKYYKLAADQSHAKAQFHVATCYNTGKGVEVNQREAFRYFKLCADQGDADAQYNVAMCYTRGDGVDVNQSEAFKYYKLSADQGNADAEYRVGIRYCSGEGVATDKIEGTRYLRLAVAKGHNDAAVYLQLN